MGDLESNDNQTVEKSLTTEDELKLIDGAISSQNDNADEEGNITLTALTQQAYPNTNQCVHAFITT